MRYVSLFSGIECASVALEPLGWIPLAFAEIDPFASALLAYRFPHVPNLGNVETADWKGFRDAVGHVDVVIFGSPCQSFSIAGKRLGLDDPRGNLALVGLGVVDVLRPDWFVFENVPGLLSSDGGRDYGAFLGAVADIGYSCAWSVLDAQWTRTPRFPRAVPQRRRRLFVVGHSDFRRAAAVLALPKSLSGDPPPRRTPGERAAGSLAASTGGSDENDARDGRLIAAFGGNNTAGAVDVATARNAHGVRLDFETETFVAHSLMAEWFDASEDGTGRGPPLVADPISANEGCTYSHEGKNNFRLHNVVPIAFSCKDAGLDATDGLAPTMRAMGHAQSWENGGGQLAVAYDILGVQATRGADDTDIHTALRSRAPGGSEASTTTVVAFDTTQVTSPYNRFQPKPGDPCHPLAADAHPPAVATPMMVRRLTPQECERLQGLPSGWTAIPYRGKPAADGPRYRSIGNSFAANCIEYLGRRIDLVASIPEARP